MATVIVILLITFSTFLNHKVFAYKASVLEYAVNLQSGPLNNTIQQNVQNYLKIIKECGENNVDIVIFPESTLNYAFSNNRNEIIKYAYIVPNPLDKITPCNNDSFHTDLQKISCEAKSSNIYTVINVSEKKPCSNNNCSPDGYNIYNTNVVFDRKGKVISRYRKTNLFGETAFNTTSVPEEETFTTDFNVTFGHLICFDLMFSNPAHNLLYDKGVKNFIVPMMWYSELPFLTAVQYQESWAISHDVNLLVAGANSPNSGCGGSGIYSGNRGSKSSYISGLKDTKIITATLGEVGESDNQTTIVSNKGGKMRFLRDHLDDYSWISINTQTNNTQVTNICFNNFCCNITTKVKVANQNDKIPWSYLAVAFDGIRTFSGVANGGIQTCAIIACTDNNITNCGKMPTDISKFEHTQFEYLSIKGMFSKDTFTFPISLDDNILPFPSQFYKYSKECSFAENCSVEMKLLKPKENILSFGIFGRVYSRDISYQDNFSMMKSTASSDKNLTLNIFINTLKNELSLSTNDILGIFSMLIILGIVHFIEMSQ